jgi:hypothetical protein
MAGCNIDYLVGQYRRRLRRATLGHEGLGLFGVDIELV